MKLSLFLKDKVFFIVMQSCAIVLLAVLMSVFKVDYKGIFFICFIITAINISTLAYDYLKRNNYYKKIYHLLEVMEKRQYIETMIEKPTFSDARILKDILRSATKAMNDEISVYEIKNREYREYIESWIHEIKTPISGITLACTNHRNDITRNISEEVQKIEYYVEQALYYARSTNLERDYRIEKINLNTIIKNSIKKYSKQLISSGANIIFKELNYDVYTDSKWMEFILGQVISNSIKYRKDNFSLTLEAIENKNNIMLSIKDNGIGIPAKDIKRVFHKGFTGENGRRYGKSTGIGLYLCKELCEKMHLGIEIESEELEGTTIKFIFPKDKLIMFEQ